LRLLALSNGHGEDEVAVRVLRQIQQQCPDWEIQAMPVVGEGNAYQQSEIKIYGPTQSAMPSGGFLYMSQKAFLRDIQSGLLPLTWAQLQACRRWTAQGGCILAVGDIVPLLFAKCSGAPFAFIGTAKSEYYLRTELPTHTAKQSPLSQWLDCVYLPWERWMMQDQRCKAVFPRDRLTATILKQWPIPVFDLGNPMMDDLMPQGILKPALFEPNIPKILLMPGSRPPEAYANWQLILESITPFTQGEQNSTFIAAIANQLDLSQLCQIAASSGWQIDEQTLEVSVPNQWLKCNRARVLLVQHAFGDALHLADVAIAMAGTATEQLVGLGKLVITLVGSGPQFTWAFAEAQSRLLGPSIHLIEHPQAVFEKVNSLVQASPEIHSLENGQKRMGTPGASARIASQIQRLLQSFHAEASAKT
jgi:uncharacterized protein (TIGR03492 family)